MPRATSVWPNRDHDAAAKRNEFVALMADVADVRRRRDEFARADWNQDEGVIVAALGRGYDLVREHGLEIPDSFDQVTICDHANTHAERTMAGLALIHRQVFKEAETARLQAVVVNARRRAATADLQRRANSVAAEIGEFFGSRLANRGAAPTPAQIILAWRAAQSLRSLTENRMAVTVRDVVLDGNMAVAFRQRGRFQTEAIAAAIPAIDKVEQEIRHVVDFGAIGDHRLDLDAMAAFDPWLVQAARSPRGGEMQKSLVLDFSDIDEMTRDAGNYLEFRLNSYDRMQPVQDRIMVIGDQPWIEEWRRTITPTNSRLATFAKWSDMAAPAVGDAPTP